MLTETLAFELASRLTLIPEFPNNQAAIEATAEELLDLCRHPVSLKGEVYTEEQQARWIVRELTQQPGKWQGISELRAAYRARFAPETEDAPSIGPKVEVACKTCNDWGFFRFHDKTEWCTCPQAEIARKNTPTLVDNFNTIRKKRIADPLPPEKRMTEAEIRAAIEKEVQKRRDTIQ